jgi:hypothetical protein
MHVSWTGHRPDLFLDPDRAQQVVVDTARELLRELPVEQFLVGGQRGVDTWAAETAHALGVPFSLLLPLAVPDFTADWSTNDRARLEHSMSLAANVRVVGGDPRHAYTERNRLLAASGDLLVAVWTRRASGGTAETVALARQFGTPLREVLLEPSLTAGSAHGRGL